MTRSIWKIPKILPHALQGGSAATFLRSAMISPKDIGATIKIHNGCKFIRIKITEQFVGYKFGAFAQTKKTVYHKRKKKKK